MNTDSKFKTNKLKKIAFIISGTLIPTVFSIIFLELIFGGWIFSGDNWEKTQSLNIIRNSIIKFSTAKLYNSDSDSITYTRNSFGLRDNCKDPSYIRILSVGGSTTDQRYINDGETYQDILQNYLQNYLSADYCISNAGVDGHSTIGHNASFETWFPLIPDLKPDFILLYIGINDAKFYSDKVIDDNHLLKKKSWRNLSAFYKLYLSGFAFYKSKISNSYQSGHGVIIPSPVIQSPGHGRNLRTEAQYLVSEITPGAHSQILLNSDKFESYLSKVLAHIDNMGAKPICVSQPHLYAINIKGQLRGLNSAFSSNDKLYNGLDYYASINEINRRMKINCIKNDGIFIDAAKFNFTRDDFYDAEHMTPSGAKKLGLYLADSLVKSRIIRF